jgi:hypothetical protein
MQFHRLRPKLMTALGAIIALLPLAIGIGTGSELHQPCNCGNRGFNSDAFTFNSTTEFVVLF